MNIALFSDVHANLPAFEAMLADMDKRKPDAVYCLGDLVGYNVWPNEVIAEIRRRGIATLAGNHDLKVKNPAAGYAYQLVAPNHTSYLLNLPAHIKLEYQLNHDHLNIMLVHGSNRNVNEYIVKDLEDIYLLELMNEAGADVLCAGHSHKPFHRILQTVNGLYKHVINIGSVGKPKDGNPQGCYVLITISDESSVTNQDSIKVEFIRFDYDVEKAAKAVEDSPLPDEFADMLRKAY